jgi:RHS repeat-associated protein
MTQRQDGVRRKRITSPNGKKIEEFYFDADQQLIREVIKEKRDERGSSEIIERSFGEFPMSRRIVWTIGPDRRLHTFGVGAIDEPIACTTFSYTKEGLLKRKELPDGVSIEYTYDSSGRLIEVESSDKTIHYNIAYDSLGRISTTRDLIHGKVVERGFNSEGVLSFEKEDDLALLFTRATDTTPEYIDICSQAQIFYTDSIVATCGKAFKQFNSPPKKPLSSGTAIDPLLQPSELIENDIRYSFDSLGQLQQEEKLGGSQQGETKAQLLASQSFSSIGSLTKKDGLTVEHDTQGRPTKIRGKKYTYDARGNLARIQSTEQDAEYEILLKYDALNRLMEVSHGKTKECYRYDYFARKREVVKFSEDTDSHIEKIRYLWLGHEEIGSVDDQSVLQDFKILDMRQDATPAMVGFFKGGAFYETKANLQGTPTDILGVSTLQYTAFGTPLFQEDTVSAPWGFMGKREIKALHAWDFGGRVYLPETCSFISQDPFWLFGTGASPYALLQNRPVKQVEIFGLFSWPETFGDFLSYLWKGVETVFWKSYESITFAKKQLDWFYEYRSHFEDLAFRLVSKSFLNLIGYNPDRSSYGTFGARELASNVRITEINGILNAFEDIFEHIQVISDCHGGMPVHYIYSATDGFTGDLLRSALAKVGFISPQARYLAATWRKLIQEMGGTSGEGVILHYAHSLGGTDTQAALSLMTQQERKMIKVNTFGAATLVADSSCNSVMNYVSIADGVPITCIVGYVQALLGWREDVCFLESKSPLPLIDHLFLGESYRRVIEELGRQFQEEYIKNTN